MKVWALPSLAATPRAGPAMIEPMISALGRPDFARVALEAIQVGLVAGSWAVYQLWPGRAPRLHLSASRQAQDHTGECFALYRDLGLYRADASFDAVRARHGFGAAVLCMHADEAPSALHREAIYRRHGMVERLSVAERQPDGSVLALNVYHHQGQGCFDGRELDHFIDAAPCLLACVKRHLQWRAESRADSPRERLQARCPGLTARELDVLERLLRGWSYEGIAADLGVSVATVKTYRARAFARLGLHFKSELFAALRD